MVPSALFGNLDAAHVAHAAPNRAVHQVLNGIESLDHQVWHSIAGIFELGQLRFHVHASVISRVQINIEGINYRVKCTH